MWFYHFASWGVDLVSRIITKRAVRGREFFPAEGPVLLVANHIGFVDPPLIGSLCPRPVHFMAKEELFRNPFVRWVVTNYGAFPVRRGEGDRHAYQTTLKLLRAGKVVGIFPEGTRSRTGALIPAHPGAAAIAIRAGVPIVPVGVWGTEQIFRWPKRALRPAVGVNFGKPFSLEAEPAGLKAEGLDRHTERIMLAIAELLPESYRGVYARAGDREESLR